MICNILNSQTFKKARLMTAAVAVGLSACTRSAVPLETPAASATPAGSPIAQPLATTSNVAVTTAAREPAVSAGAAASATPAVVLATAKPGTPVAQVKILTTPTAAQPTSVVAATAAAVLPTSAPAVGATPAPLSSSGDFVLLDGGVKRLGRGALNDMSVSPDGRLMAFATSLGTQIFDAATLTQQRFIESAHGAVTLAFSPDGKSLAVTDDDPNINVYDVGTGTRVGLPGQGVAIASLTFGGARLGVGHADSKFDIYDLGTRAVILSANALPADQQGGNIGASMRMVLSPDGRKAFISSFSNDISVWDVDAKQRSQVLTGHTGIVSELALSRDGKILASCGDDGTVRLWDASSGALLRTLKGHAVPINTLAFSADGARLVSGDTDNTIKVWDVTTGALINTMADTRFLRALAFSADGGSVYSADAAGLAVYDVKTGGLQKQLSGYANSPANLRLSADGNTLALSDDEDVIVVDNWKSPAPARRTLIGHVTPVQSIGFSADGQRLASASLDDVVLVWDLTKPISQPQRLASDAKGAGSINSIGFNASGSQVQAVSLEKAMVWEAATGKLLRTTPNKTADIGTAQLSPGRTSYAMAGGNSAFIADFATGAIKHTLSGPGDNYYALAWSADGKLLATVSEAGSVKVWNADTGKLTASVAGNGTPVLVAAFSLDGSAVATGGDDNAVRVWSLSDGKLQHEFIGHSNDVLGLLFAPDGLISSSADGTVRVWPLK